MTTQQKTIAVIVAVLFVTAGLYFVFTKKAEAPTSAVALGDATSSLPIQIDPTKDSQQIKQDGYTINVTKKPSTSTAAPSLNTPVAYPSTMTAENKAALAAKIAEVRANVQKNPTDGNAWLSLGVYYKMAGDYAQAKTAWEYLAKAAPKLTTTFHDLADLYTFYIKDYPKAEQNYLQAIALDKAQVMEYIGLHELYRDLYHKSATAAGDILKKGIAANPNSLDLHLSLARYYKTSGRNDDAQAEYKLALGLAQGQGGAEVVNEIKAEAGL